jgi:flagellar hook-basal body complex protein FliE
MSDPMQGIPSSSSDYGVTATLSQGARQSGGEFVKTLQDAMSQVGQLQSEADDRVGQLLAGNGQDIHSAMIAVEKAGLAFEMMVQVRNKIVQAYQQVSGMQF